MFSHGIERAIEVALEAHADQRRRGDSGGPYVVHPIHAAFMLARLGLSEISIQAALLHDVVEDCPGWTLPRLSDEFGAEVAAVVEQLTEDKARSWEERKRDGVERIATMSPDARAVKAADKLHNLTTLVRELQRAEDPALVWTRFRGGRERTLAMSSELVHALSSVVPEALSVALQGALRELQRVADGS